MDTGILRTDLLSGLTADILRAMRDQSALAADQTGVEAISASSAMTQNLVSGGGNMMDNLFVHSVSEESRYMSAMKTSLAVQMQMRQSQASALLEQFGGINPSGTYLGSNGLSDQDVKDVLKRDGDKEIIEEAKKDFDKTAEEMEEKAEEAVSSAGNGEGGSTDAAGENTASGASDKASAAVDASGDEFGAAATDDEDKDESSALAGAYTETDKPESPTEIIAAEADAAAAKKRAEGIDSATRIAGLDASPAAQAQIYLTQQNALSEAPVTANYVNTVI